MFFEVTPPRPKIRNQPSADEDVAILSLAPFSAIPKICFENVKVGVNATRRICIKNPWSFIIDVAILKVPEVNNEEIDVSWTSTDITACGETILELHWCPKEPGAWRDVLRISNEHSKLKRDVYVIFKAVLPKQVKSPTKQRGRIVSSRPSFVTTKVRKVYNSNKKRLSISPKKRQSLSPKKRRSISPKRKSPKIVQKSTSSVHPFSFTQPRNHPTSSLSSKAHTYPQQRNYPKELQKNNKENYNPNTGVMDNFTAKNITYDEKYGNENNISFNLSFNQHNHNVDFSFDLKSPLSRANALTVPANYNYNRKSTFDVINGPEIFNNRKATFDVFNRPQIFIENETFNDSLENIIEDTPKLSETTVNFSTLLNSESFCFTPLDKRESKRDVLANNTLFRRIDTEIKFSPQILPTPRNDTFDVSQNISTNTYTKDPVTPQLSPISTKNLDQKDGYSNQCSFLNNCDQISPILRGSFNNASITSQANISTSTQKNFDFNYSGRQAKNVIEANLWSDNNISQSGSTFVATSPKQPQFLSCIQEETHVSYESPFKKPKTYEEPRRRQTTCNSWTKMDALKIKRLSMRNSTITEKSVRLHNPDEIIYRLTNPDPFSAVITHDPFMSSTLCYDEQWVYKQELEFKKWLNALLTPHMELECKETQSKIDIAKIWEKSRNKDVVYAPSKETVSSLYHTNNRLNSLRKKSIALFNSSEITGVLSKVMSIIERKKITIREDKNLHLDLGLQAEIMQLLLCYNPLWLRIGLESVYGETIPLRSNSDIIGLSTFIILRFFTDPFLKQKHSVANVRNVYLPTFAPAMKKFTLKKFLMLVYFLDQAKLKKLIPHDPCLFCTNAPIKESRQILLEFSKELLAGVGDITKYLKVAGCVLTYKQVALDEFVYAVKDVGTDLRDGVRLTRVMEIILMRNDLSKYMRTPAISRLQKIHNVRVAFTALEEAGFVLLGDIAAKDIVEGHREKTLSLLWQIIYKFRAPIFNEAAKVIQEWWRSFRIIIIRRIRQKQRDKILYEKQNRAAFIIQKYFRSYILTLKTRYEYLRKISLVRKVQNRFRATILMRKQRAKFLKIISSVEIIQQHLRATLVMKIYRGEFLRLKYSVILIQRWFRSTLPMKKQRIIYKIQINAIQTIQAYLKATLTMRNQREHYLRLRHNTVTIQKRVRATLLMRQQRAVYLKLRSTIIKIQALYRMKRVRNKYLIKLQAIRCIQQHFRAYSLMKAQRGLFTKLRESAIIIQGKWRATLLMRQQRIAYLTVLQQLEIAKQEKAANVIVNHIQAFILMKKQRCYYLQLKSSALIIQNRYRTKQQRQRYLKTLTAIRCLQSHLRATLLMRRDRENYINKLHAIRLIQTSWRATLQMKTERKKYLVLLKSVQTIQNYYRNYRLSVMQRNVFLKIKNSTILIQNHWRATLLMREHKNKFIRIKNATKTLQTRFRAQSLMKKVRQDYLSKINAVKCIQHFYRSYKLMTQQRWNYLKLKNSTVKIQIHWRATLLMQKQRTEFIQIQNAVKTLQRRFRAKLLMKKARKDYLAKIQAAKYIQNFYRSYKLMTQQKSNYIDLKKKVLSIQSHWRATLLMRKDRNEFIRIQNATKTLQTRLRAQLLMKKVRQDYLIKIQASKCIQNFYRSYKIMTHQKSQYLELKKSTLIIQNRWRATLLMRKHRKEFIRVQIATSIIQSRLRAQLLMKAVRKDYLRKVEAARCIQNFYRSYKIMIQQRSRYLKLKNTALIIQNRWRATLLMRKHRNEFIRIQIATNIIQSRLRAQLSMKIALKDYLRKIEAAKCIQNFYRRYKLMIKQKSSYLKLKNSALIIQNRWRATVLMRNHRKEFIRIQIAANIIQSRFRAFLLMKKVRKDYLRKIEAAKCIQNFYRSYKLMTRQRSSYLRLKNSTLIVQSRFRATILMRKQRFEFIQIQNATKILQTRFRAQILMRKTRMKYLKMVKSAQIIQNYYRGYKIMMQDRLYYLKLKNSPRMILMRKYGDRFTNIDNATKTIQSRFRAQKLMKQTRQDYIRKLNATITIQKYYRAYLCMRQQREKYLQIKRSVIFIQNKWRTMIQIKRESAATKIQAYFRGYIIRKQQCKKMKLIRQRSIEATLKATTENTVGFKCSRIMDYFLSERMTILSLCHALQQFDILTTVCPTVCVGSVIVITDQIFLIFDFSNRSEPYRQACTLGSNVLNNFIGYQGTRTQILRAMDVEKINILLKLMNAWADKDFELFPNLCTFLWILCQNEEQKQLIKEASNSLVMLRNMHTKAKRLETIKTNKHQHGQQKIQKLKLPTTKSWWKDERFTNSLFGITSILKLFNNDI